MEMEDWKERLANWQAIQGKMIMNRTLAWHEANPTAMADYYAVIAWYAKKIRESILDSRENVKIIN